MVALNGSECMPLFDWSSGLRSGRIIVRLLVQFSEIRWAWLQAVGTIGGGLRFFILSGNRRGKSLVYLLRTFRFDRQCVSAYWIRSDDAG